MVKKLCIVYNFAQHYRTGIFRRLSEEFDCDFFFGDSMDDVKKMDYSVIKGTIHEIHTYHIGSMSFQKGICGLLMKDYDAYILLGETHSLSTWLFLLLSKLFPKKRVFLWSHGWYGKESKVEKMLKKVFFRLPSGGVFLYGNYARNCMINEGFNPMKLFTIHNSLDYEKQRLIRDSLCLTTVYESHFNNLGYNLVFIGRLTPVKKLDMIIRALKQCLERGMLVNCTFVGDGSEAEKLRSMVEGMDLCENIWFYGPCYDEAKIGELLFNADLCVSPGNVGLTAMHSLVYGTPVLTHNNFPLQMPEFEAIVEGKTGAFFESDSIESLSMSIINWLTAMGPRREIVRKACFEEIDHNWTPDFQMRVIRRSLLQDTKEA